VTEKLSCQRLPLHAVVGVAAAAASCTTWTGAAFLLHTHVGSPSQAPTPSLVCHQETRQVLGGTTAGGLLLLASTSLDRGDP
jgi:hypothetical protein